jgi:hypothetical protein
MRHVAIFGDNLQTLDRFCVSDDIIEENGAVLFDPKDRYWLDGAEQISS